jgi:hypothetical protein
MLSKPLIGITGVEIKERNLHIHAWLRMTEWYTNFDPLEFVKAKVA